MVKPGDPALAAVREYHQRTKHHFQRYAAGPGRMDWASQPDPFRSFAGCPRVSLPLFDAATAPPYHELYRPGGITPRPLSLPNLAALLELAFGISAWKQYAGTRWALRCNPSSGNLHPTEAYAIVTDCPGIADGVHHYLSRDHALEQRCRFAPASPGAAPGLPPPQLLLGLSSIHWREAWKYGERAYRYCQHDAGHALAAARYAAALLGWRARWLAGWADDDIAALLGLARDEDFGAAEREQPDLLLEILTGAAASDHAPEPAPEHLIDTARRGQWQGRANILSEHHRHDWPIIDTVAAACRKPRSGAPAWPAAALPPPLAQACPLDAATLIRQRRSAQAFDGSTAISAAAFYRMLDMTLPRAGVAPWDAVAWPPRLDILLFVHRVDGLAPGLYVFLRGGRNLAQLRAAISGAFEWLPVAGCPAHFRLFRLVGGDAQDASRALSCHQDIAADGAFSLAMLAEYDASLGEGPWIYRQLFWEAGILGQVLYLEAEAAGVRGTGIGCYFDDGVHELLGLSEQTLQDVYHFTVGGPVADPRLQTLPAYGHST